MTDDQEERATPIRVLLANMERAQQERVEAAILQQPDMLISGHVQGNVELLLAVSVETDVLIMAQQPQPLPAICSHLLSEFPQLKVIVVDPLGDAAVLYWLGLRKKQIQQVSLAALLTSIRYAYMLNPAA